MNHGGVLNHQQDPEPEMKNKKPWQLFQNSCIPLTPPTGYAWEASLSVHLHSKNADGQSLGGAWSFKMCLILQRDSSEGRNYNLAGDRRQKADPPPEKFSFNPVINYNIFFYLILLR